MVNVKTELETIRLKSGGVLSEESVVDEASKPDHPLHDRFTWDDSEAGRLWRLEEARMLIRSVYVTFENKGSEPIRVRAYTSLPSDRMSDGGYRSLSDVMSNKELRKELLAAALSDLEAFQRKYSRLEELAPVFIAMQKVRTRSTTKRKAA